MFVAELSNIVYEGINYTVEIFFRVDVVTGTMDIVFVVCPSKF